MSERVRQMFAHIAPKYDLANSVLSLGLHQRWRRKLVTLSGAKPGDAVLDVATGTGDLAFQFLGAVGPTGRVVGVDFCTPMIERAREKAKRSEGRIEFREADALALPFGDASFDVASIAFGIRNVDDPVRCASELGRVVRPGGRVAVLEFGQPRGPMKGPYALYSRFVIPRVGQWLTGDRGAYEYLPRTAQAFPSGDAFVRLMESTGRFARVVARPLTGGIVYAYVGTVGPK